MKGIEFGQVRDAISRAFTGQEFDMFLFERFEYDRPVNVDDGPFRVVVDKVLRDFTNRGMDAMLIAEVAAERPFRQDIQDLYQKFAADLVDEGRRGRVDESRLQAFERYGLGPKINIQKQGSPVTPAAMPAGIGFERTIKRHLPQLNVRPWRQLMLQSEGCVCRVEVGSDGVGTGFLVGPDVLLTNYHVLRPLIDGTTAPDQVKFRFDYALQPNGRETPGQLLSLHQDWVIDHSKFTVAEENLTPDKALPTIDELDYALVKLERPVGNEALSGSDDAALPRGWLEVPTAPPLIMADMPILILQHPNAQPLKLALDTQGVISVNANNTRVRYATNTESGSSGSPCFDLNWNLVALHHYGDPAYKHPQYNQGIPIARIRDRLTRQGKADVLAAAPVTVVVSN
jgi:hypothetical protein